MKRNLSLLLAVTLAALSCTGCRDPYDVRSELQAAYPDAAVTQVPGTDLWVMRLPNGAVMLVHSTSSALELVPVQFIPPLGVDEFVPEYQFPALERK